MGEISIAGTGVVESAEPDGELEGMSVSADESSVQADRTSAEADNVARRIFEDFTVPP